MSAPKKIFLFAPHSFAIRYLVYSNLLKELRQFPDLHLVVFLPEGVVYDYAQAHLTSDNVEVVAINAAGLQDFHQQQTGAAYLNQMMNLVLNAKHNIRSIYWTERYVFDLLSLRRGAVLRKLWYWFTTHIPVLVLRHSRTLRNALRYIFSKMPDPQIHPDHYQQHHPDLVIMPGLGKNTEAYLMSEAKHHHAKILSIVLNWDNTTSYGIGRYIPDHAIAWNNRMAQELTWHHDVPADRTFVGGVAHYDIYHHEATFLPKAEFYSTFGLQPDRKIIFYGAMTPTQFPWNPDIVEMLAKACAEDQFHEPCQILVRLHPIYYFKAQNRETLQKEHERFKAIQETYGNVVYNYPQFLTEEGSLDSIHPDDLKQLANLLKNSDVVLSFFSTLMLEATIFDVPSISLCLEGKSGFWGYEKAVLEATHLQDIFASGGVKIVYTPEEMIAGINYYLEDPTRDQRGRQQIRDSKCGPDPGQACQRMASHIHSLL